MDSELLNNKSIILFKSFVKDLISVYPEHKIKLYEHYGNIMVDETKDISKFLENINKYEKLITNRNNDLFKDNIYIFEGISMNELWKKDISESTKSNIWKYLQTFCVIYINLKSSESLKELLSGEIETVNESNKKDLKDLKKLKKIKENINETKDPMGFDIENMLNNSSIGKIAKEISESLNLDDPNTDMSNILEGNTIMNIFNKVNETIKHKIDSGELSDDILKKEATSMYPDMMNNELFKNMANMAESSDLFKTDNKNKEATAKPDMGNSDDSKNLEKIIKPVADSTSAIKINSENII
jgi:hypothetical protein